ncbi:MAG: DUF2330 domain-containing protein [Myxococcales bacterium]|nr:DUF2330 domain-containing protein [Myxococcales bacterium]
MRLPVSSPLALAGLVALASLLTPAKADACGGTFCDSGPQVMPVDQTGETIAFWVDETGAEPFTEAHIQIQYEGDAERFAWIIPVTAAPEVMVGSQALFDNLLAATVPTFTLQSASVGDCFGDSVGLCALRDLEANIDLADDGFFSTGADDVGETGGNGPTIIERGFAGAFEYVTLTGDTVQEVVDWLDMAGYAQDPDAPPILQEYLDEGFVFVAVKLRSGAGVDEIHPLTIRYPGTEPCIPIRLTRIAAVEDMAIRAFFLGDTQAASSNWPHVELNWAALDWLNNSAASYDELVSLAIDEAGGRAFVTEFAGDDAIVSPNGLYGSKWNSAAFAEIAPELVIDELGVQGLFSCTVDWDDSLVCTGHPQVPALLEIYLPTPVGVSDEDFWNCLSCYLDDIDPVAWAQQPGFAADLEERIVVPGKHAVDMLNDSSYLTRLYTRLSPVEMIEDPLFHLAAGLDDVAKDRSATNTSNCEGNDYLELADGRVIAYDDNNALPDLDMPAADRIVRVPAMGPAQVETDNRDAIDDLIDTWNKGRLEGPQPGCSVVGFEPEAVLTFMAIFGIAGLQRRRRRR